MARKTALTGWITDFADQSDSAPDSEFVIPDDLSVLSDEDLAALSEQALTHFDSLYGDGNDLSEEDVEALSVLTGGIEALQAAAAEREGASAERAARAAELAGKIRPAADESAEGDLSADSETDGETDEEDERTDEEKEADAENETEDDSSAETVTASGKGKGVRLNLNRLNSKHLPRAADKAPDGKPQTMKDVVFASGEGTGFSVGQGVDWNDVGQIVDRRLASFNKQTYEQANRQGRHMRQQFGVMSINKPLDHTITSNDPMHVEQVLQAATNEKSLKGNSLVAAGGWCAPSETLYDLLELESRDGIFSLPEVGITRGGITRTLGPDFSDIFTDIQGFSYSEDNDVDGTYGVGDDGVGDGTAGDKPCYKVTCPEFEEFRLGLEGLCITAGLLQQRGYPEVIARTVRGALVAHDHRLAGRVLGNLVAGSDAVTIDGGIGATAPLLRAVEFEVEQLRTKTRMSRNATMEAVFPMWTRGVIRADLALRNGIEAFAVTDAMISQWFAMRGIAPQFVYNWQDLDTATSTVNYPDTIQFLLYPAGTWIRGNSDVITLDTLYDSTMLGQNDYTALFTEEGFMTVKMGHESRVVEVPVAVDGADGLVAATLGNAPA